ncbi:MAG: hypothetical protein JOZ04_09885, partial [Acidimicrobiia bacterium]|nr:hypothetical protein [Acidimicrobiia bacterium]
GLGTTIPNNPDVNQAILGGLAEQAADPPTPASDVTNDPMTNGFVTKDLANITQANPLLYANLLRGQGKANWSDNNSNDDPCGATQPLAFGLGHAADAELLNTGSLSLPLPGSTPVVATDQTQTPPGFNPTAVDQAQSLTKLIEDPANPGHFIVHSETREIVAPVTLFKGTTNEVDIQIGGEWVLSADASGNGGGAHITYAPDGAPTPTTPIIRVFSGGKLAGQLTTQDILMNKGLNISIPPNPAPPIPPAPPILLEISAGEQPYQLGNTNAPATEAADGTLASGGVDVARVKVLNDLPQIQLADVRIGHMEVNAQAPVGGVTCSAPAAATTTSVAGGTTTTAAPGATTTTAAPGATTTTTAGVSPGGATTTTAAPGATTTTENNPGGGTTPSSTTTVPGATTTTAPGTSGGGATTTTAPGTSGGGATTTTAAPAQVQAVTFSQSPAATPQAQTPSFTG